jgi:nucleoside-diphosphate-sugar epimerase
MNNTQHESAKHKVLLTGAAGYLGTAIRHIAGDNIELVCVDIKNRGDSSICEGTYTDTGLMEELLAGCDTVIHTAGLHGGNRHTHSPAQFIEINVAGTVALLELCIKLGVRRCVFSSSMEVLLGHDLAASGMSIVDEQTRPNPSWIYPVSKLMCEQVGECYHRHRGLEFVALRYQGFEQETEPRPHLPARRVMVRDVARANLLAVTAPHVAARVAYAAVGHAGAPGSGFLECGFACP